MANQASKLMTVKATDRSGSKYLLKTAAYARIAFLDGGQMVSKDCSRRIGLSQYFAQAKIKARSNSASAGVPNVRPTAKRFAGTMR